MRLRKLKYPLAFFFPNQIWGGKNAALASHWRWAHRVAEYYLSGAMDDVIIVDSSGQRFEIEKIELRPLSPLSRVLSFILTSGPKSELADVDMVLRHVGTYTLDEFCQEIRATALKHPEWWERHSDRSEIEQMFEGCDTFKAAINDIGVLDPSKQKKRKGRSLKTVDLR